MSSPIVLRLNNQLKSSSFIVTSAVHCAYPRSDGWGTSFESIQPNHLFEDLTAQLEGHFILTKVLTYFNLLVYANSYFFYSGY